jgi:hypothetical protein
MVENEPTPQQQRELHDKLIKFADDAIHWYLEHAARDELLTAYHLLNLAQYIDTLAWLDQEELKGKWLDLLTVVEGLSGEYGSIKRGQAVEKAWELGVDQTVIWFNPRGRPSGATHIPLEAFQAMYLTAYKKMERIADAEGRRVTQVEVANELGFETPRTLIRYLRRLDLPWPPETEMS